jgi:hypothetical protein
MFMKTSFLLFALLVSATGFAGPNGGVAPAASPLDYMNFNLRNPEADAQWAAQQQAIAQANADANQAKKDEILRQEAETESKLNALKADAVGKAWAAANAESQIEILRKSFLNAKLKIPRDPWREIYGEKKFAMSPDSDFVKFDGQILETAQNGIRLRGSFGNIADTEFIVMNYPTNFSEGEYIDPSKTYMALKDGIFSYVTTDGSGKTIPKLNYGKSCSRPQNADEVEAKARQLTQEEESQINGVKLDAIAKKNDALAANKIFNDFLIKVEDDKKAKIQAKNVPQARALKFNQDLADKGDAYGLLRMGERYRDGDGVPKDLNKAREYFTKAIAAGSPTAAEELEKSNQAFPVIKSDPAN